MFQTLYDFVFLLLTLILNSLYEIFDISSEKNANLAKKVQIKLNRI